MATLGSMILSETAAEEVLAKLTDNGLGLSESVQGCSIEVRDPAFKCSFEKSQRSATSDPVHELRRAEA